MNKLNSIILNLVSIFVLASALLLVGSIIPMSNEKVGADGCFFTQESGNRSKVKSLFVGSASASCDHSEGYSTESLGCSETNPCFTGAGVGDSVCLDPAANNAGEMAICTYSSGGGGSSSGGGTPAPAPSTPAPTPAPVATPPANEPECTLGTYWCNNTDTTGGSISSYTVPSPPPCTISSNSSVALGSPLQTTVTVTNRMPATMTTVSYSNERRIGSVTTTVNTPPAVVSRVTFSSNGFSRNISPISPSSINPGSSANYTYTFTPNTDNGFAAGNYSYQWTAVLDGTSYSCSASLNITAPPAPFPS